MLVDVSVRQLQSGKLLNWRTLMIHHLLSWFDNAGRPVAAQAKSASKAPKSKTEPAAQPENPTLAQTTKAPEQSPGRVDSEVLEGGVSIALLDKKKDVDETGISTPEDFWTPLRPPPSSGEYKDQYGKLSAIPQHDGTDCLKTDDSLWSHAEHFKVSIYASGPITLSATLPPGFASTYDCLTGDPTCWSP